MEEFKEGVSQLGTMTFQKAVFEEMRIGASREP